MAFPAPSGPRKYTIKAGQDKAYRRQPRATSWLGISSLHRAAHCLISVGNENEKQAPEDLLGEKCVVNRYC